MRNKPDRVLNLTRNLVPTLHQREMSKPFPPSFGDVQPPDILDEVAPSRPLVLDPYQPEKYKNRPGTKNFGNEYEWRVAALLSLRCIFSEVEDMAMAMNMDKASDFDDIIFTLKTSGREAVSYMIQLKHENKPRFVTEAQLKQTNKSRNGSFSLHKYSDSIEKFQESGKISNLADFRNIYFVLFTNRPVNDIDFLVRNDDQQMKIINTKSGQSYSIDCTKLNLEKLNSKTEHFCKFRFLPSQLGVTDLVLQMIDEVLGFCDLSKIPSIDPKAVVENYIKFIEEWSKGSMGGHYYLTKEIICQKLCELLLAQYEVKFNTKFLFYDSLQKLTWNEIVGGKEMTIVDYSDVVEEFLLSYIGTELKKHFKGADFDTWSRPMSKEQENLFCQENANLKKDMRRWISNFGGITAYDLYNYLSSLKKIPKLLVVRSFEEYQSILNILNFFGHCFKIIVLNKGHWAMPVVEKQLFLNLKDLTEELQGAVLRSLVKFDERPLTALGNVLNEDFFHCVSCSDIIHILCNMMSNNLNDLMHRCAPKIFMHLPTQSATQQISQTNSSDKISMILSNLHQLRIEHMNDEERTFVTNLCHDYEADKEKMPFSTEDGHYYFNRMLFWLQAQKDQVITELKLALCLQTPEPPMNVQHSIPPTPVPPVDYKDVINSSVIDISKNEEGTLATQHSQEESNASILTEPLQMHARQIVFVRSLTKDSEIKKTTVENHVRFTVSINDKNIEEQFHQLLHQYCEPKKKYYCYFAEEEYYQQFYNYITKISNENAPQFYRCTKQVTHVIEEDKKLPQVANCHAGETNHRNRLINIPNVNKNNDHAHLASISTIILAILLTHGIVLYCIVYS